MISGTAWVPHGFSAEFPTRYELDDEEIERIASVSKLNLDDAKQDLLDAMNEENDNGESDLGGENEDQTNSRRGLHVTTKLDVYVLFRSLKVIYSD